MGEVELLKGVYQSLPQAARRTAVMLGVAYPGWIFPGQLATALKGCGFRDEAGKYIPKYRYKEMGTALVETGIAYRNERQGLAAYARWAPWLTLQAFREGRLRMIERALRSALPAYRYAMDYDSEGLIRRHVVAGRFRDLHREMPSIEADNWRWLVRPGVTHLLATLPGRYLDDALEACISEIVDDAADPAPVLAALQEAEADQGRHCGSVALIRVMQGRPDRALELFARLPEEVARGKPARVAQASAAALVATLQSDDATAVRQLQQAIARDKAGTRRRNVFPLTPPFAFALLSLVRDDNPRNTTLLQHLVRVGSRLDLNKTLFGLILDAAALRKGDEPGRFHGLLPATLPGLCEGLVACWQDDFEEYAEHGGFGALFEFGTRARANGYRWLAAEAAEVMARLAAAQPQHPEADRAAELAQELAGTEDAAGAAGKLHRELGTVTLASLLAPAPVWEYALRGIEQFAHEAENKSPGRKKPGSAPARRLAWIFEEGPDGGLTVAPREQSRLRSGKWSKGRVMALRTLRDKAVGIDHLTEQDRKAASHIAERKVWPRPVIHMAPAGIFALAGHPAVFNRHGQPVEVVRRDPELAVEERDGRIHLTVDPHVEDATNSRHDIRMVGATRCEVTRFTDGHRDLCGWIPLDGLTLPASAQDRVIRAFSSLSDQIRIQGVLDGDARAVRRIDGDPVPWVRLQPGGAGLNVALVVEPVPDSGIFFQPGIGGTTTFATAGGEGVQARRDLEAERQALRRLVEGCPALAMAGPDLTLALTDPAECLELIDQLETAGARCQWPQGQPFRIAARAEASSLRLAVKSAADWFTASGSVAVDEGRAVDLRKLFELLDANPSSRFVPLGDGAFLSLTASFRRQLADLRAVSTPSGKKRIRLHGLAALAMTDLLEGARITADAGWDRLRGKLREAEALEPRIPRTLQAELRPYQEDGFRWLARLSHWGAGACLADDMGLGKTVQSLALLLERAADGPALVVAPTSVVANWVDEARRFAPTLKVRPLTGAVAARARLLGDPAPFDLFVTTYGLLHNDIDALAEVEWSSVILDEAQAIRNPATQRARASRRLNARFRMATTGTPIQNSLADLHSIFSFLNPGLLGGARNFRENFALPIERGGDALARMRLRRLIAPFVLRRVKADVLDDLPSRTEVTLHVEMSPAEASFYEALRLRAVDDLEALANGREEEGRMEEGSHRMQLLAHLTRLRLACCNPALVHADGPASSKLRTFADTLDELRRGRHRVLVFSQFVRHLRLVEAHVKKAGIPYQYLDGSTPAKARAERIQAFQRGEGDLFLISLKAGGVGLNLTAADYVVHMDPWWNPAAEDQASDRAHRIGQTRPVTIYRLVTRGTIEEQIVELHRHKRELADRLLEGTDSPARLSTEEMLRLLREGSG